MAYSCQMCQVSSCFCPNTASLRGRNPSLQNVCQGSPDVKQAHQSNRLSLPLDICKSLYFSVCSKSFSAEHAWPVWHVLEMYIFLSKKNYIAGEMIPAVPLLLSSGCPVESNLWLTSQCTRSRLFWATEDTGMLYISLCCYTSTTGRRKKLYFSSYKCEQISIN